mgnify:CR=1 FL=1
MKKKILSIIAATILTTGLTAYAAPIPRESVPMNADETAVQITENLISDILDDVAAGKIAYTLAAGYANARVHKAVIAGQTGEYGYGVLSPIAQNAVRTIRDMYLRPEVYVQAEAEVRALIADIAEEVSNGLSYDEAVKQAYTRIYQSIDANYEPRDTDTDFCYTNTPPIDTVMFTMARKVLIEARAVYENNK